ETGESGNPAADNPGDNTEKPGDNAEKPGDNAEKTGGNTENPGEGGLSQEGTWTKDIVIQDSWTPGKPGADGEMAAEGLSIDASEALPIKIRLEQNNEALEGYDSYSGGVEAEYGLAAWDSEAEIPPAVKDALEDYNERMKARASQELSEGKVRHEAYQAAEEGQDFIYLTSWFGMQSGRMDTQMVSWVERVYRYNREYEANYFEVHGVTLDTQTGRKLSLSDIFTDVSDLGKRAFSYEENWKSAKRNHMEREDAEKFLQEAIDGNRDDGSFAWCVFPDGVEFRMVIDDTGAREPFHYDLHTFLPFSGCGDILRDGVTGVSYDYLGEYGSHAVSDIMGTELPKTPDGGNYYYAYLAQKNGKRYFLGCDDERTNVYAVGENGLEEAGSVLGELGSSLNSEFFTMPDPENFRLNCRVSLLQELFLHADARLGEDGLPERRDLFYTESNPAPIIFSGDTPAEVFENRESVKPEKGTLPRSDMFVIRTDGETFVDAEDNDDGRIYRLYIGGNDEDGWTVNGRPADEVIGHIGWWEE
ncbi:MAG: hypothetical protein K6E83_05250, partial [Clostridium sp.]|nr:hypothetical protein [Clostridium sp.]